MLKRILASLALTSLLLTGVLLVCLYRSNHGHVDGFVLGKSTATQTHFTTQHGRIQMEVTDNLGSIVTTRVQFFSFRDVIGYLLILPSLWVAVTVRNWLPRPPGRERKL